MLVSVLTYSYSKNLSWYWETGTEQRPHKTFQWRKTLTKLLQNSFHNCYHFAANGPTATIIQSASFTLSHVWHASSCRWTVELIMYHYQQSQLFYKLPCSSNYRQDSCNRKCIVLPSGPNYFKYAYYLFLCLQKPLDSSLIRALLPKISPAVWFMYNQHILIR